MFFRNKRIINLFLSLVLVLGIVLAPVRSMSFAEEANTVNLTIVHTNDVHGRVEGDEELIGFPRFATYIKQLKAENPNVLVLDAGDITHGTTLINISRGEAMINLMNAVGYDAMAPGNHDFNNGYERLVELSKIANFPILAANVIPKEGEMELGEYVIKEIGGLRIGIFGLATQETVYKSHPKNTEGVDIVDPIAKAKEIVERLQAEDVDMIIALSHLGLDDGSNPKSSDLAEQVEGIDLIVDGHSHSLLPEGLIVGDTLIVQTGEYLKNIGVVNITFTDGEITAIEPKLVSREEVEEVAEDEEIMDMIAQLNESNNVILSEVIGKTNVRLVGEREIVRTSESNLGNLMTDALLNISGADVALTNGGGIRASIEVGDITKGDVLTVFPFGNTGVKIELTGADILAALEHGVKDYPAPAGGFPHVAGMKYKIDPSQEPGNRVYDVYVQGQPLDLEKTYTLVTNDFMAAGGDGYTMFAGKKVLGEYPAFDEILADYISQLGEINIGVEGRIVAEERAKEEPVEEPVEEPKDIVYIVKPGDVLWKIARKFGTTWQRLAEYNKLKNPHLIFPNQKILIPAE
mgnify:FL=1